MSAPNAGSDVDAFADELIRFAPLHLSQINRNALVRCVCNLLIGAVAEAHIVDGAVRIGCAVIGIDLKPGHVSTGS